MSHPSGRTGQAASCMRAIARRLPPANELMAEIHDRMPLLIAPGDYAHWLSTEPDPRDLLRPFPAEPMRMWPISTRVNKPENEDPFVVEPIEVTSSVVLAGRPDA